MAFLIIHLGANCSLDSETRWSPITAIISRSIPGSEVWRPSVLDGKRSFVLPMSLRSKQSPTSNDGASIGRALCTKNDKDRGWIEHMFGSLRNCGSNPRGLTTFGVVGTTYLFGREIKETSSCSSRSMSTTSMLCLLGLELVNESHPSSFCSSSANREDSGTSRLFS